MRLIRPLSLIVVAVLTAQSVEPRPALRKHHLFFTDCDKKIVQIGKPLAAIRVADRTFWVLLEHGYEDETFVVVAITPDRVERKREAGGGGC